jgi:quinol monooxygenase YgiN
MQKEVYVSITGLQLRRVWHIPSFWLHAMKSMVQARKAPGNISADARTINGVHHTLSVWTDKDAMRAYLTTGPHLEAMRLFPSIATGKVFGYQTDRIPDWSEINAIWRDHGRTV